MAPRAAAGTRPQSSAQPITVLDSNAPYEAGNPRARHKAIELAWLWLRHQPDSALSQWFRERTLNGSGRIKRIAIVALARKLIAALWRYLTTGLVPEHAVLKAKA